MGVVRETYEALSAQKFSSPRAVQEPAKTEVPMTSSSHTPTLKFKARGLYDFAGLDEGELAFRKLDVLNIVDDSSKDWWKAELNGRTGLIPSNYVSRIQPSSSSLSSLPKEPEFDSTVADRLLSLLSTVNPAVSGPADNDQVQALYKEAVEMRPALIKSIEFHTKKQEEYGQLLAMLEDGLIRYKKLASMPPINNYSYSQTPNQQYGHPSYAGDNQSNYPPQNYYSHPDPGSASNQPYDRPQ